MPSTSTQTPGDPPDGDVLGEGVGEELEGLGQGLGEEPGVGAPGGGCEGRGDGCEGGDVPGAGEAPGVGTGTSVPVACGFGAPGLDFRAAGCPGSDPGGAGEDPARPGLLAWPGPGEDWMPGRSAVGSRAAACGAPDPCSIIIAMTTAVIATAAVSSAQ
jgi:hypothetical protein